MPTAVSFVDMVSRARQWADAETGASLHHIPAAEAKYRVNSALKQLYSKLVRAKGADYYAKQESKAITGAAAYNITAADFWQLLDVRLDDGSSHKSLDKWMPTERAALLSDTSGAGAMGSVFYRLREDSSAATPVSQILLLPIPSNTAWTLTIDYVPAFTDLVADADTFNGVNGWEDWAVLTAAIGMLAKQGADTAALERERLVLDEAITALAAERDAGRPERIQDVLGDWAGEGYLADEWEGWG